MTFSDMLQPHRRWPLATPLLLLAAIACSQSVSVGTDSATQGSSLRPVELVHEPCDLQSKEAVRSDVNNDSRSEVTRVMKGGREVCRAVDLNFDGRIDSYLYFDAQGALRRRESDFDRDGQTDEIATYQGGKMLRKERETNLDGKLDTWDFYQNEVLIRTERDSNADGRVDQWWSYPDASRLDCPVVETDTDGDGRPDARMDVCKEREAQQAAAMAGMPSPMTSASAAVPTEPAPADAGSLDAGGDR